MCLQSFVCVLLALVIVSGLVDADTSCPFHPPHHLCGPKAEKSAQITNKEGCGWRKQDGVSFRILGPEEPIFGEFPWVVAIFIQTPMTGSFEYWCVGALIHPKLVLTGRKLKDYPVTLMQVRAGDWDLSGEYELYKHQTIGVSEVVAHPDYDPVTFSHDISILVLKEEVKMAPNVGLLCLPSEDQRPPPGTQCIVAGWGYDSYNGTAQNIMKMIELPIVERGDCQARMRKVTLSPIEIDRSMLCAGGEPGKDACKRDGGAPLMCPYKDIPGRYYQAGLVSWGVGCGRAGLPGVYTDIAQMVPWIKTSLRNLGIDPPESPQ